MNGFRPASPSASIFCGVSAASNSLALALFTETSVACAAVFVAMGATFVPIFLGLDLVAVIVAFLASFRAGRRVERVQVTSRDVRVVQETPREQRLIWESPTAFTQVQVEKDEGRTIG